MRENLISIPKDSQGSGSIIIEHQSTDETASGPSTSNYLVIDKEDEGEFITKQDILQLVRN